MTEDNKLIRQILTGDKEAFEQLVRKHYQNIYAYCYRRTGNEVVAADLTQDVFLKLVSSIYNYRFFGKFTNYIFTIAVNTCNDYFRKLKPDIDSEIDQLPTSDNTPMEETIKSEENKRLYDRLNGLPDKQKILPRSQEFHLLLQNQELSKDWTSFENFIKEMIK